MTYQPHTWTKGETITAQLLQNMDNGVAAAIDALESAFGQNYTAGSKEYKVDFTDLGANKTISAGAISGTTLTATGVISGNTLDITAASDLKGNVDIGGTLTVEQIAASETKDIQLNGKLIVTGKDVEVDNSTVKQAAGFTGTLDVSGATKLDDQLTVTGDTILKGNLTVGSEIITEKKAIILNDAIKIDTDSSNRIIIGGRTQINAPVTIGNSETYYAVNINGIPTIYGQTLSITNSSRRSVIKLKPTGEITAKTLVVDNELIIGTAPSQTAEATGSTRLYGTTTIDKLIVGDSTSTADNEIYGFTTISNLTTSQFVVGTAADEENEHAATGSTVLYGTTNTDNLIVGKATLNNDSITYSGTTTFNTTTNILHGTTNLSDVIINKDLKVSGTFIRNSYWDPVAAIYDANKTYTTDTIVYDSSIQQYKKKTSSDWTIIDNPYLEIIGNGTANTYSNARVLDKEGNEGLAGDLVVNKNLTALGNLRIGPTALSSNVTASTFLNSSLEVEGNTEFNKNVSMGAIDSVTIGSYAVGPWLLDLNSDDFVEGLGTSGTLKIYSTDIKIGLSGEEENEGIVKNSTTNIYGTFIVHDSITFSASGSTVTLTKADVEAIKTYCGLTNNS